MKKLFIILIMGLFPAWARGSGFGWDSGGISASTVFNKINIKAVKCGGVDDTASINAALFGGNVHVTVSGACATNASMVIYSNTWLEITPGSSITQVANNTTNLMKSYAYTQGTGRDSNIKITGGSWVRNASAGSGQNLHAINLNYVDGLITRDVNITTTGTFGLHWYCMEIVI